jgi:hypothetical protein
MPALTQGRPANLPWLRTAGHSRTTKSAVMYTTNGPTNALGNPVAYDASHGALCCPLALPAQARSAVSRI